jgi:hypothetical protein
VAKLAPSLSPKWLKDEDDSFETIATSPVSWWREDLPANNWALAPTDQSRRYTYVEYLKNNDLPVISRVISMEVSLRGGD